MKIKNGLAYVCFVFLIAGLIILIGGVAGDLLIGKPFEIGVRQMHLLIIGGVFLSAGIVLMVVNRQAFQVIMKAIIWPNHNPLMNINRIMVFGVLCYAVIYFFWGEVIPVEGGFGFDGTIFRSVVKGFPAIFIEKTLRQYYIGRVVPSLIVYFGLRLFRLPLEDIIILQGFKLLNLALIVGAVVLWGKISDLLGLKRVGKWLGFVGLFVNYGIGKYGFYYPPLTDQMAFFLGMLMLFFYLKRNRWGLLFTALLGAFTMNTIFYAALLLFVLGIPEHGSALTELRPKWAHWIFSGLVCAALAGIISFDYFVLKLDSTLPRLTAAPFFYLSLLLAVLYLFFAMSILLASKDLFLYKTWFRYLKIPAFWGRLAVAVALYFGCQLVYTTYGVPNEASLTSLGAIQRSLLSSVELPGIFLLADVAWYGPIVFLVWFFWGRITRKIRSHGPGLVLFFFVHLLLGLSGDARYILGAFPFFIAFAAQVIEELELKPSFLFVFVATSFLASKIWLWFNAAGRPDPWTEYYLMSWGSWMSDRMYCVQGCIALAIAGVYLIMLKGNKFDYRLKSIGTE